MRMGIWIWVYFYNDNDGISIPLLVDILRWISDLESEEVRVDLEIEWYIATYGHILGFN